MFANGKYSRLRYISVLNDENRSNVQLSPIRFIKFLMSLITPTTEFLAFSNHPLDMDSIGIISIGPYLGGIQVLNLENTRVKLPELIALIKLLSNMIRLICQPATTIFEPDSVQLSDHINELHAQNHPLNHRLKHWEVVLGFRYEAQHVASTALALAVLCTNFVLAFAPFKHRKEFERDIKTAIDSNLYNEHKSKIQRLFHNMD
ncbi:hypothetical protein IW140_005764 [Coemansia sp. RSA 1813]|nr:hypothetical protein IW140_005764 [Coemansia sp. RSA 1813]